MQPKLQLYPPEAVDYSRNQIKNAGKRLRRLYLGEDLPLEEYHAAILILDHWRACHSRPLTKATLGLKSRVRTAGCSNASISQRLKRRRTMIDKLTREPSMQLTTMQDIGGCRAVLMSVDEVRHVERRWLQNSHNSARVIRTKDYISEPKASGYRGVHIVVQYSGFPVEVQLRTPYQHAWATAVEKVGPSMGYDLKSGAGPEEVVRFFKALGDLLAATDGVATLSHEAYVEVRSTAQEVPDRVLKMVGLKVTNRGLELGQPGA